MAYTLPCDLSTHSMLKSKMEVKSAFFDNQSIRTPFSSLPQVPGNNQPALPQVSLGAPWNLTNPSALLQAPLRSQASVPPTFMASMAQRRSYPASPQVSMMLSRNQPNMPQVSLALLSSQAGMPQVSMMTPRFQPATPRVSPALLRSKSR